MGQAIPLVILVILTSMIVAVKDMNTSLSYTSFHAGVEISHFKCANEVCLICKVSKDEPGLNWKNEISKEVIAFENRIFAVFEKIDINSCESTNYSIRINDTCSMRNNEHYTCRKYNTILQAYLLYEEVEPTLQLYTVETENSPTLTDSKIIHCKASAVRMPIYVHWYINSHIHYETFNQNGNYSLTTITSSSKLPHKEKLNVSCEVTGPFVSTEIVSKIVYQIKYENSKNAGYIILGITGATVLFVIFTFLVQKGCKQSPNTKRYTTKRNSPAPYHKKRDSVGYFVGSLDTSVGNVDNLVYESQYTDIET